MADKLRTFSGGCHCRALRFELDLVEGDQGDKVEVEDCNCSICRMTGFLHIIVPKSHFRLLSGSEALATYRFNTGVAKHTFCRHCGVKAFYTPRSNPQGVDVNFRCLDAPPKEVQINAFDGIHWEQNAHLLANKA